MAYSFVAGPYANLLSRAASSPTATPSADSNYPVSNLYDGIPAVPFVFGSATSDSEIVCDLNLLSDPSFETSTTGWTASSTSTFTQSSTAANTGSYSGLIDGTATRDIVVRANEALKLEWATAVSTASMQVRCLELNQYLTSGAAWAAGSTTYVLTNATTSWTAQSITFVAPASTDLRQETATLRLGLIGSSVLFDDVTLYPAVSWVSAHGHNWTGSLTAQVLGSSNSSTYTAVSTMSVYRDAALATFSTTYYRYWKLLLSGVPYQAPYVGELVLGQYESLAQNPSYGGSVEYREKQVRKETPAGTVYVYNRGGQPVRTLKMSFTLDSSGQYLQSRRSLYRGSRGGANMIAIAASEMDAEQVIYGRISEVTNYSRSDGVFWTASYDIIEDALPTMSS